MLINNDKFVVVVSNDISNNSFITGDNVDLNKQYKFVYTLENNNKPYVYKTTGEQMLFSFNNWANQIAKDIGTPDLGEVRHVLTTYICPFATRQISKKEFRSIIKDYDADPILLTKNAVKDKTALQAAHELIEAYMYLKHIDCDIEETVLSVVDCKPDKYTTDEILKNWEKSPLVKDGYVKTKEEYLDSWSAGSLVTNWLTEQ